MSTAAPSAPPVENACKPEWLELLQGLFECPTAPLMEDLPAKYVLDFAKARPELSCSRDEVGNIYVGYPKSAESAAEPLILVAHLDHPGFWVDRIDGNVVHLTFKGGVGLPHAVAGSKLRFFRRGERRAIGRGVLESASGEKGRLEKATAKVTSGIAEPGGYTMWDFPGYSFKKDKITARCCDDLGGAAAALCVLHELAREQAPKACVWGLFTRGEELGFYGALSAVKRNRIPKNARVISLECSRALPNAPQGAGVIVRIGDASSIFDPGFSESLRRAGQAQQKLDPNFKFQRRLMDGGTCEATVFCAEGLRSAGLALPLGNYHNQAGLDGGAKKIGAESILASDFASEVKLLLELARLGPDISQFEKAHNERLEKLGAEAEEAFKQIALKV